MTTKQAAALVQFDLSGDLGGCVLALAAQFSAGKPAATVDVTSVVSLTWQLTTPTNTDAGACSASFGVENAAFY